MRTTILSTLGVLVCATSCVRSEDFRPVGVEEPANVPESVDGPEVPLAREYKIDAEGRRVAEVKVSSEGAFNSDDDTTIVHVAFEIANHHNRPLTLTWAQMTSAKTDEGPLTQVPSTEQVGDLTVAPGADGKSEVFFELPDPEVSPQNLDGFTIHWVIDAEGLSYEEDTQFVEITEVGPGRTQDEFYSSSPWLHPYHGEGYPIRFVPRVDSQ